MAPGERALLVLPSGVDEQRFINDPNLVSIAYPRTSPCVSFANTMI